MHSTSSTFTLWARWLPNQFSLRNNAEWDMFMMPLWLLRLSGTQQRGSIHRTASSLTSMHAAACPQLHTPQETWYDTSMLQIDTVEEKCVQSYMPACDCQLLPFPMFTADVRITWTSGIENFSFVLQQVRLHGDTIPNTNTKTFPEYLF